MKLVARIMLVLVLFTSVATAWDSDICGQGLVFDSASVTQSHDNGSPSGNFNDLCGHCGHLGSHLLGYVASAPFAVFQADRAWHNRSATVSPKSSLNPLFRPPRNFFAA